MGVEMGKRKSKAKPNGDKIDGLNPADLKNIHKCVRQAWSWSHVRRLAVKRATGPDGYQYCEDPKHEGGKGGKFHASRRVPKLTVDHIEPVGEVGGQNYIQKMWTPSKNLLSICPRCHYKKTREDEAAKWCFVHGAECPKGCKKI